MKEIGKYYVENEISVTVFEDHSVVVEYLNGTGTVNFTCDSSVDYILSIGEEMARILTSLTTNKPHEFTTMYELIWLKRFFNQANISYKTIGYSISCGDYLKITSKPEKHITLGRFVPYER